MLLVLGQFSNSTNTCTSFDDFRYQDCLYLYKIVYQYEHRFLGRLGFTNDTRTPCVSLPFLCSVFRRKQPHFADILFHQHESLNIFKNIWCASPMLGNKVGMLLVLGQFSNCSNTCTSFDDFQYQNCLNLYKIVYQYTHLFLGRLGSSNDTLTRCVFTAFSWPLFFRGNSVILQTFFISTSRKPKYL